MSDEEETVQNFLKTPPLTNADSEIISNFLIQVSLFAVLIVCYVYLRPRVKWLYSPNIQNKTSHPCYSYNGYLNWLIPIFSLNDSELLILIGLDAFMMLQTLKYIYRVFAFLVLTVLPLLGYIYWTNSNHDANMSQEVITKISLGSFNAASEHYYIVPATMYIVSVFMFYSIFIYYKRYTVLRQLFLRDPSTMTSIITLNQLSNELGTTEKAAEYLSMSNRTILVSNLPNFVKTDADLKIFFESMKVGDIEASILIHDTRKLRSLNAQKNETIENIEKEINNSFAEMDKWSQKNKEVCSDGFQEFKGSILESVEALQENDMLQLEKKINLFKIYINKDDNYKSYLKNNVKLLDFYFDILRKTCQDIVIEKRRLQDEHMSSESSNIIDIVKTDNSLFIPGDIDKDASFFGIYHILYYKKYSMYFSLDLPFGSRKGFVIFKSFKDASIVRQAKLGSKIFSVKAERAPNPNDIIWDNINKNGVSRFFFQTWGNVIFVIFNLLFTYIVVNVADMIDLKNFNRNTKIVSFFSNHQTLETIYQGNVPSLVYNLLLLFVPMIITTLVNLEGINSYSKAQHIQMSKYSNFLFFNGFISMFFAKTFYNSLKELITKEVSFDVFVHKLGNKILNSVVFFINTVIQKSFFGAALILLKPAPLLVNHVFRNIFPRKTRRQEEQAKFSPPTDFGSVFPVVLIVFPMVLVYSVICPLVLIPGLCYFIFVYLIYKNEFLYATRNQYESGGRYWEQATKLIIYSLLTCQIATAIMIFSQGKLLYSASIIPLVYITWIYKSTINKIFAESCNCYPLNIQEEKYLDEFTNKINQDRISMLSEWKEYVHTNDEDTLELSQLGYTDVEGKSSHLYYKNPDTTSTSFFMLPHYFFKTVRFLINNDLSNVFGYKNSDK